MRNLVDDAEHDLWSVNTDAEYLEEGDLIVALSDLSAGDAASVTTVV